MATANEVVITGTVQVVFERIDTGNFSKRDIVIRTDEQYPQDISIQFTQDKCDLLDLYKPGEVVTIAYNLRGKAGGWVNPQGETKYFTTVQGWKIQRPQGQHAAPQTAGQQQAPARTMPPATAPAAAPAARVYVHTATDHPEAVYLASPGWNHEVLVAQKKGYWQIPTPAAAPAAPGAPQFPAGSYPPPGAPGNDDLPF